MGEWCEWERWRGGGVDGGAAEMTGGRHEEGEARAEEDGVNEKSVQVEARRGGVARER